MDLELRPFSTIDLADVVSGEPAEVWEKTREWSGITEEFFRQYFDGRSIAYAIGIKDLRIYEEPIALPEGVRAPQSYRYVDYDAGRKVDVEIR